MTWFCLQLEMERALLEGEHQTEMDMLQSEQENITTLKQRQLELLEIAAAERGKVGFNSVYHSVDMNNQLVRVYNTRMNSLTDLFYQKNKKKFKSLLSISRSR